MSDGVLWSKDLELETEGEPETGDSGHLNSGPQCPQPRPTYFSVSEEKLVEAKPSGLAGQRVTRTVLVKV